MPVHHAQRSQPYSVPVARLNGGHAFGNAAVYVALDRCTDIVAEPNSARLGLRDAYDQVFYLGGWQIDLLREGRPLEPTETSFGASSQWTDYRDAQTTVRKEFILPFENNHLRAFHVRFERNSKDIPATLVRLRALLPAKTQVTRATQDGHVHIALAYAHGPAGVIWGSSDCVNLESTTNASGQVECIAEFAWDSGAQFAVSFAYSPHGIYPAVTAAYEAFAPDKGTAASHLRRVETVRAESASAVRRYFDTGRLWTPDAEVNAGADWAKINQLRDYQEYRAGAGFSNNPPSDVVVARDTFWFLMGSNFYAQAWSHRMLDLWFERGQQPSGKFTEYLRAATEPLFDDDYGLNLNDNTPLLLIASHHYYAFSGDRGFLDARFPAMLRAANYLLAQRRDDGLLWCTSTDTFVRGLCGWRNCTQNYRLTGAVTEINAECHRAFRCVAELAREFGDPENASRFTRAADALHRAINRHLRSDAETNPFYLLRLGLDGERVAEATGDLLFPALLGVAPPPLAQKLCERLFSSDFWTESDNGGGGMRTIGAREPGSTPKADPDTYGLQGGVWPNLALWAGRAAASAGRPELTVKGLIATRLLADREDGKAFNVTPGQFPEYYNGDDLLQRGCPRSTFIHGSYVWAATESFLGITPHADALEVEPSLPRDWDYAALSNLSHRDRPLTLIALREARTLFSTARVRTSWKQVRVSAADQERYRFTSTGDACWLVTPRELIVVADRPLAGELIENETGRVVARVKLSAAGYLRHALKSSPARRLATSARAPRRSKTNSSRHS